MHILILPSFYPENLNDPKGSFFREQALALADRAGVKVGVLNLKFISLKYSLNYILSTYKGVEKNIDNKVYVYSKKILNIFPGNIILQSQLMSFYGIEIFKEYIEENGLPDVIHVHCIFPQGQLAKKINNKYNIPYVITEHSSNYALNYISSLSLKMAIKIAKEAKYRIAVSSKFAKELEELMSVKWAVISNMVENKFLENLIVSKNKKKFLFVSLSYLTINKNIELLIESFYKVFKDIDDVFLEIGGAGQEYNNLKIKIKELNMEDKIKLIGLVPRNEVVSFIGRSNVFLLSSNYETFGVVLIEALALGVPVISTKCGGPEDIINKNNGILVEINSVKEMSEAMDYLYRNYNSYNAKEIRDNCRERFGKDIIIDNIVKVYSNLI